MKSKVVYIEDEISEKLSRYLKRDGMTFSGFVRKEIVRYIEEKEIGKGEKRNESN